MQNDYTHITFVLDRSGSMESIRTDAIGGFNRLLADQQQATGRATMTLIGFDDQYEIWADAKAIGDVARLTTETYQPRASTALLDAIGRAITDTGVALSAMQEHSRPAKVIFVVLTDGLENSSRVYSVARINEMIALQRDHYTWQFVFLAADQDAIATAAGLGIGAASSLTFAKNAKGSEAMFMRVSEKMRRSRDVTFNESAPIQFNEDERQEQRDLGA